MPTFAPADRDFVLWLKMIIWYGIDPSNAGGGRIQRARSQHWRTGAEICKRITGIDVLVTDIDAGHGGIDWSTGWAVKAEV